MDIFKKFFPEEKLFFNEQMSKHTTFQIGGAADLLFMPAHPGDLHRAISICRGQKIPYFILGNGSNVLVSDDGFRGVIIKLYNFTNVQVEGKVVHAQSGVDMRELSRYAEENSLTGLEFAEGIPATVGGAVCMNAGAYGSEMKDVLIRVDVLRDGEIRRLLPSELEFGYRTSLVKKENLIVLSATFLLEHGEKDEIRLKMADLNKRRLDKQPLEFPSAGSVFKRPEGYFAGKLIQDSGLQGVSIGGAEVSTKHAGFIINKGNATAKDVLDLIKHVQKTVKDKFGVELEREIILL
ncbi:MAG: UDP-N-acetylmuramate dehydrogenase [Defluviitaleaceae bacterium]|nr:UDP-N-acetylmuramate dehydrogenase [Defluviitaleaceae bacterium]